MALQFHLEVTPEAVTGMVENCGAEIVAGPFIQSAKEIMEEQNPYQENYSLMIQFLEYLCGLAG